MHIGRLSLFAVFSVFFLVGALASAQTPSESPQSGDASAPGSVPAGGVVSAADTATVLLLLDSQISNRVFLSPEGRRQMQDASAGLTEEQKLLLFSSRKKDDALIGAILNSVLPGLGSALQSDWGAGALVFAMRLGGAFAGGLAFGTIEAGGQSGPIPASLVAYFFIGGLALGVSSYVLGILRPFFWVSEWNNDLAQALGTKVTFLDIERSRAGFQPDSPGKNWTVHIEMVSFRY